MLSPVIATLANLVRINSVNSFYENGPGETEIASWIHGFFRERGIEVFEQPVLPGRNNIIARIPGQNASRNLLLEAHMDTVSTKGMTAPPFVPRIEGNRLHGRGACDDKAGLAAMMHAVAAIKEAGIQPPCNILMAAVVDEECSFRGVVKLCDWLRDQSLTPPSPALPDLPQTAALASASVSPTVAIVAEPTEMRAVIASKGAVRWRIRVRGKAAHSAKPHLGINAIQHMARIVLELEKNHLALAARPHPLLGPATCNVGVIQGGVQVNFVPDDCVIEIDRRLLPGETAPRVLDAYQNLLDSLQRQYPDLAAAMEPPMLVDDALETPPDSRVALAASDALREFDLNPVPIGVPFCSDASKLSRAGIPTILFGPGSIDRAHTADEFVEIDQVEQALKFYRRFLLWPGWNNDQFLQA